MALKNKSMYAILGILNLSPSTGYDIKMYSDKVLSGFWNENFGHIYPTLKTMLENGTIEVVEPGTTIVRENTARKIRYGITDKGRRELTAWLSDKTTPQPVRSEFMLKLLFSNDQPPESVVAMLEDYRAMHVESGERYLGMQRDLERGIHEIPEGRIRFINAVLRNGILASEATVRWCDETIRELRRDPPPGN